MFLTTYDRDASRSVPSGSRYKDEFQLVTEPDGNTHLEVTGTKDIYKEIQSYKDGCMIENIVRRALNGDPTALSRHAEAFGDVRFDAESARAIYPKLDFMPNHVTGYVACLCGKSCDIACYKHLREKGIVK